MLQKSTINDTGTGCRDKQNIPIPKRFLDGALFQAFRLQRLTSSETVK